VYRRKGLEARRHGHALWGKAQINVTHELASMPYMPTPFLLRDKFAGLARLGVEGIMCCWIFGGYPGVGAEQANAMMWEPFGLAEKALLDCAAGVYGRKAALPVVKAWRLFSRGYAHYPFDRGLYAHVLNDSPSHPFFFPPLRQPEGDNWRRKLSPRGDILTWCWSFTPEVTARCYRTILKSWDRAVALLRRAIRLTPPHLGREAERDLRLCEAIGIHFRSGLNYVRFIRLRDRLPDAGWPEWPKDLAERYALPPARGEARIRRILADMRQVIADEERLVASYLPMVEADSRLGYHSEGGYRFRPKDLRAKLRQLRRVRDLEIPRYERRVLG
jgi:hypothetical protein